MIRTQDIVVLSLCTFLGNIGVSLTGFGTAITYFIIYQIAYLSGFKVDFRYALFVQALSFISIQPLLLYKTEVRKHASRKMLLYLIPITLVSTPVGQVVGNMASADIIKVVGGGLICLVVLLEIYQNRDKIISLVDRCRCKRKGEEDLSMNLTMRAESMGLTEHKSRSLNSFHMQYTLGDKLGEGAFSTVREGKLNYNGETFAVKIINKQKLTEEESVRLENEIMIMQELNECKGIVQLYDSFDETNNLFLVTKMMRGGDLLERLDYVTCFKERQARGIFNSILETVIFIHSKNIAHRDLKLENILCVSNDDNHIDVLLADFGFAKMETKPNSFTTMCGTPAYVAPEILKGVAYGKKVDMWSLGVIAFNLLSGYQPFQGEDELDIRDAIMDCHFEFDEDYWKDISNEAKSFIESLLTLDPAERPASKDAIYDAWFSKNLNKTDKNAIENNSKVFFMIGSQRSGSNWLRTMLDEREDLVGPHPPHIMRDILPIIEKFGDLSVQENYRVLVDHVCVFVEYNQVPWTDNQGKTIYFNRKEIFSAAVKSCERVMKKRLESNEYRDLEDSMFLLSVFDAIMNFYAKAKRKPLWICKSMGMSMFHKELMEFYGKERLRYVYLVRDPRDVAMSFMNTPVGDCHYHPIITKWTKLQRQALHIESTCPEILFRLHYESILANKKDVVKELYSFMGERKFGGVKRQASIFFMRSDEELIDDAKLGMQAQLALNLSVQFKNLGRGPSFAVNQFAKWKDPFTGLKDEDIQIIESVAHEVMEDLCYETHLVGHTTEPTQFTEEDLERFAELNKLGIQEMNDKLKIDNPEDFERRLRQSNVLSRAPKIIKRTSVTFRNVRDSYISEARSQMKPEIGSKRNFTMRNNGTISCGMVTQRGYYPGTKDNPNQDAGSMCPVSERGFMLFSIYDGHGLDGHKCSNYANEKLPTIFENSLNTSGDVYVALETAYALTHRQLLRDPSIDDALSGTTATVALLRQNKLIVSNVGDSTCIMGSRSQDNSLSSKRLCTEHTALRDDERERIIAAGGKVMTLDQRDGLAPLHENWDGVEEIPRVWSNTQDKIPGCAFTRSLGDSIAHQIGISARPEFFEYNLTSNDTVMIVVSDGVTQFLSDAICVDIVSRFTDPSDAAEALVKEASDRWLSKSDYRDDITALVVFLDIPAEGPISGSFDIENGLHWEEEEDLTLKGISEAEDSGKTNVGSMAILWTLVAGAISGLLGGFCGIRSPPFILYFSNPPSSVSFTKESERATDACIAAVNIVLRVIFYLIDWRRFEKDELTWFLLIYVGCSILGVLIGSQVSDLVKDSTFIIRGIMTIFLVVCGVSLMTSAIHELI